MNSHKRLNIDGSKEKVVGYGWNDDGKSIIGYYVTTENYQLYYNIEGNFLNKENRKSEET